MRKILNALFSETRQELLSALVLHPERWWYGSDLARHLGVTPSTIQRDLGAFTEAGILERREEGRQVYYRANPSCPILSELQSMFIKTAGLADVLRDALKEHGAKIEVAFLHGSLVRGDDVSESDADLMVIGGVKTSDLTPSLQAAEKKLSRSVNASVYRAAEYGKKLAQGNHFLKTVHTAQKLFLLGDADDLAAISKQ